MYDMTDDQRRLTFLRDNVESLAEEKALMDNLISALQSSPDHEADQILRRLRSPGADASLIAREIQSLKVPNEGETTTNLLDCKFSFTVALTHVVLI